MPSKGLEWALERVNLIVSKIYVKHNRSAHRAAQRHTELYKDSCTAERQVGDTGTGCSARKAHAHSVTSAQSSGRCAGYAEGVFLTILDITTQTIWDS